MYVYVYIYICIWFCVWVYMCKIIGLCIFSVHLLQFGVMAKFGSLDELRKKDCGNAFPHQEFALTKIAPTISCAVFQALQTTSTLQLSCFVSFCTQEEEDKENSNSYVGGDKRPSERVAMVYPHLATCQTCEMRVFKHQSVKCIAEKSFQA